MRLSGNESASSMMVVMMSTMCVFTLLLCLSLSFVRLVIPIDNHSLDDSEEELHDVGGDDALFVYRAGQSVRLHDGETF